MVAAMNYRMTALERAFQLAKSGKMSGITEIVRSLKRDGYATEQVQGPALIRQLTALIRSARLEDRNADRT